MGKLCQLDTKEHLKIKLDTNASWFSWGGNHRKWIKIGFLLFSDNDTQPIDLKKAEALYQTLIAIRQDLENHRVNAYDVCWQPCSGCCMGGGRL